MSLADALVTLRQAVALPSHRFWPDDLSLLDTARIDRTCLLGPKQITDVYLLALAVQHGGRLVTFDRGMATPVVRGATSDNLVVLR